MLSVRITLLGRKVWAHPDFGERGRLPATNGTVVTLVRPRVSEDTVRALEYLLQEARAGRVVGLAWASIRPGYLYEVDVAGEARRSPAFSQGIVLRLIDEIGKLPIPGK